MKNYYYIFIINILLCGLVYIIETSIIFIFYLIIILLDNILIILINKKFVVLENEEKYFEEELIVNLSKEKNKNLTSKENKVLVKGDYFQIYQIINQDVVGDKERYNVILHLNRTLQDEINTQRERVKCIVCNHIDAILTILILVILKYIFKNYNLDYKNTTFRIIFLLLIMEMMIETAYFYLKLSKKEDFDNFVFLSKCYIQSFLPYKALKYALDRSSYKLRKELNPFIKYIGDKDYDNFFNQLEKIKNKELRNFMSFFYAICIKNTDRKNDLIKDYKFVEKKDYPFIFMNLNQNFLSLILLIISFLIIYFGGN